MKRTSFILKAGSKLRSLAEFDGDYEQWIARGMGVPAGEVEVIGCGAPLPPLDGAAAVVITGSASMVTERAPWMVASEEWLREAIARSVPVLGICFGHQLLAQALGGVVGYNPRGVEVGTVALRLTEAAQSDPLFSGLPGFIQAQVTHRQTVLRLPAGATLLATSALDGCQAFRIGACAWGVQFHPELAPAMVERFIDHFHDRLVEEGKSPARLKTTMAPSPEAADLLPRFGRLAGMTPSQLLL